jgi:hypothetical protein
MIEASRKFAERILREGGSTDSTRLSWAYRQVLSRNPNPEEIKVLLGVLTRERVVYARDKTAAIKLLKVGESLYDDKLNAAELAAWTSAAGVLFNLDEAVTKG